VIKELILHPDNRIKNISANVRSFDESLKQIFVNPDQFKEIKESTDISLIESFLQKRAKDISEFINNQFKNEY